MIRQKDLELYIHQSYQLIKEYEDIIQLSENPKEKVRSQRAIDEQWILIKNYITEYADLCKYTNKKMADDLVEIASRFQIYNSSEQIASLEKSAPREKPFEIFFSYAHEDKWLRNELLKHLSILEHNGQIISWYDHRISPGSERIKETEMHLNSARIILLLVSSDFIASDYCYSVEMQQALTKHTTGEAVVIPIILRPVDWQNTPLGRLSPLPNDGKPITIWDNQDMALLNVSIGISNIIKRIKMND